MMHYKEEPSRPKIQHVMLPYCNGRNQIPCYPSTLEVFQGAQSCLNLFCFPSNKLPVLYCICASDAGTGGTRAQWGDSRFIAK